MKRAYANNKKVYKIRCPRLKARNTYRDNLERLWKLLKFIEVERKNIKEIAW